MSKASMTPGELYINRDRDFKTGEWGPYVKIGIVRKDRKSKDRASEHQTGNPREVVLLHTFISPMVDRLETLLHNIYSVRRVSGEWFEMSEEFVDGILIPKIDELIIEQKLEVVNFIAKGENSKLESNGKSKDTTLEDMKLYNIYSNLSINRQVLEAEIEIIRADLIKSMGSSGGIDGILELQQKRNEGTFNQKLFAEKEPELFSKYIEIRPEEISDVKGNLTVKNISKLSKINENLDKKFKVSSTAVKEVKFEQGSKDLSGRDENQKNLHQTYLEKLGEWFVINHRMECMAADFANRIGEYESLGEIVTWKRGRKVTPENEKFNSSSFKRDHPDLFERYKSEPKFSVSVIVSKMRSYPF